MIIVAFIIPCRIAFETRPNWYSVYFEFYMDIVFSIDIIRMFNTPVKLRRVQHLETIYARKDIAKAYITRWFIFDLYSYFPLAYLRYISDYEKGSHDEISNLLSLNFERMPRLYKIMLIPQILRAHKL